MVRSAPVTLELVLPGYVPDSRLSLNGRHRTHWAVTSRLRREAAWHLVKALLEVETEWVAPDGLVQVDVVFVYPLHRRRDPDGLAAMATPLLNMLVAHGLLWDDDSEHVELAVRAVVERGVTETRLTLRAAERGS